MKPWLSHQAQDLFLKGLALHQQNRLTEAKVLYQKALALQPKHFDALFLLGVITDDPVDSEKLLRKATQIQPAHVHALYNHGVALQDLNRIELAQTQYQKVVQLEPTHAMAHYNLGLCHFELDHLDAALRHLQKAIELEPGYVMAYNNLGATYKKMNQPDLALAAYQQALDLDPSFGLAGANMAFVNLQHARFEAGWSHYPNRHQTEDAQQIRWEARVPQWRPGQAFDRLLVVAEQGVGDEVFHGKALECFIRQHGAPACVTLDPRLVPAYQRSFPQVRFVASGALTEQDLAQVESQMALGDLMWILAMNPHVNKEVTKPHLSADAQRPALLSFLAGAERRPRVGLAWKIANPKVGAAKSNWAQMALVVLRDAYNEG